MRNIIFGIMIALSFYTNAYADHLSGKITLVHLNGLMVNRHACVKMSPAIPDTGWACIYKDNPLYKEIYSLLLTGYSASKTCTIGWNSVDADSHKIIFYAECQ